MAYKIAVVSGDGVNVDLHFGAAESIDIYEVQDDGSFYLLEKREMKVPEEGLAAADTACASGGCGNGNGGGCGNGGGSAKVSLISDVRAVVAAIEKKAIASFDVECSVQEALEKITKYFYSVDNHVRFGK